MQTSSDFVRLPYTPDLTEGGIAYALRSLPYSSFERLSAYDRIRRKVAGAAVELAFRRYLSQQDVPFQTAAATPFAAHDQYDVSLAQPPAGDGRRCDIQSFLISRRNQILEMRRNPALMLNAPALVASDQHAADERSESDLYVFAFLAGLTAVSQNDLKKIIETNLPRYFIHAMPELWRKPMHWNPLGTLVLKSESDAETLVEISGQDAGREFLTRTVNLPPKTRVTVADPFYSIAAIHVKDMPSARLGIHFSVSKKTYLIAPAEWGNIWVYGMDIYFTGFITRGEFRQRANLIAPNSRVFQYEHTRVKNLAVPISELKPLQDLLTRAREWKSPGEGVR